ncbi:MAG: histidine kinase [Lewinellaceae bacterium]|nr:histidine kinase [Lewinellaceae bacterium]
MPQRIVFLLLFWLLQQTVGAQPFSFLSYSVAEGLPQSQVWCTFSDSRGYLWFGTQGGGLCRYDGRAFETFNTDDGLPSNFIQCIGQDRDYGLLIGTNRGLCRFDGRNFKRIGGSKTQINALIQRNDGSVWAGTNAGIWALQSGANTLVKLSLSPELDQAVVHEFWTDSTAAVWIATERGVWKAEKTVQCFVPNTAAYAMANSQMQLWVCCWGQGIKILNTISGAVEKTISDPLLSRPLCIFGPVDNCMWVGTQDKGLMIIDLESNRITQVSENNGLPHNHVRAITTDRNGQCWIATSGGGVARRLRQNFRHYTRENGLAGNRIYAVYEAPDGRLWFSASLSGIQLLDSTGFHPPVLDSIFPNTKCKTICGDPNGRLWVGTEGKGLAVVDTSGVQIFDSRSGLMSDWVQKIVCDPNGQIWVAAAGITAISRNPDGTYTPKNYGTREGLPDLNVSTLVIDQMGKLWFGTQNGRVGCISKGKVEWLFGPAHGLPSIPVRSLCFDRLGRIWVGTKGSGIWVSTVDGPAARFEQPSLPRRSELQNIYLLIADPAGRIWAGTETGVDKIVLDTEGTVREQRHYGKNEGFLGIETCQDAAVCDTEGRLWFGTMNGLTRYTPGDEVASKSIPQLHFEGISLFYKALATTPYSAFCRTDGGLLPGLELPYGQNHLSFSFSAVELEHPERLHYRWKLEGAEEEWSPASEQESVNYANLPPGFYNFWVQASTDDNSWSPPLQASFSILEPFWQKNWFRLLALLSIVSIIALTAFLYVRRIKQKEAARREQLEVQNHILQLEQKALQLQMNPHFIFNALTSIQSLITAKSFAMARQQINEFARLMRNILNNSRRPNISLKEEIETLDQYLRIEQFCHQDQFNFTIQAPETINLEELELPPCYCNHSLKMRWYMAFLTWDILEKLTLGFRC